MSGFKFIDEPPVRICNLDYAEVEKRFVEVWARVTKGRSVGITTLTPLGRFTEPKKLARYDGPVSLGGVVSIVLEANLHWRRFLTSWISMLNVTRRNIVVERMLTGGQERVKASDADKQRRRTWLEWDPETESFQHFKYV